MMIYLDFTNSLRKDFAKIRFAHINRDENAHFDALAYLASTINIEGSQGIQIVHLQWLAVLKQGDLSTLMDIEQGECWMTPITDYLQHEKLAVKRSEAQ